MILDLDLSGGGGEALCVCGGGGGGVRREGEGRGIYDMVKIVERFAEVFASLDRITSVDV